MSQSVWSPGVVATDTQEPQLCAGSGHFLLLRGWWGWGLGLLSHVECEMLQRGASNCSSVLCAPL